MSSSHLTYAARGRNAAVQSMGQITVINRTYFLKMLTELQWHDRMLLEQTID